jgi:phenylalanyl-tRNA synthetase beta subunit
VSLSLRVTLAAADRTLTTDEMKGAQEALIAAFDKQGWRLKG